MDIVIPTNNENTFVAMAEKLGTKELLFLYSVQNFKYEKNNGVICSPAQLKEAKKKTSTVFVKAEGDVRKLIEQKPYAVYGFEYLENKDSFHHRRSGIDQVSAKIMADNDVAYAFSFSDLLNAPPYMQSIVLGRMYQNLMIAKKYKVKVIFASFATTQYELRNEKDMKCLV